MSSILDRFDAHRMPWTDLKTMKLFFQKAIFVDINSLLTRDESHIHGHAGICRTGA